MKKIMLMTLMIVVSLGLVSCGSEERHSEIGWAKEYALEEYANTGWEYIGFIIEEYDMDFDIRHEVKGERVVVYKVSILNNTGGSRTYNVVMVTEDPIFQFRYLKESSILRYEVKWIE